MSLFFQFLYIFHIYFSGSGAQSVVKKALRPIPDLLGAGIKGAVIEDDLSREDLLQQVLILQGQNQTLSQQVSEMLARDKKSTPARPPSPLPVTPNGSVLTGEC